jgi:HEAT repeat protein
MVGVSASAAIGWLTLSAASIASLTGCGSSAMQREHLVSPYPPDRARAAVQLAEAGDAEAIDLLIELLTDQDRGVRMYTILALERLCGETYGYNYYDAEPQRAAAVARWREARQGGEVTLRGHAQRPRQEEVRSPLPDE